MISIISKAFNVVLNDPEWMYLFLKEAYFYLFSLGIAAASLGVFLWLGFYIGLINAYPLRLHGSIMFFSFLFSFVMGFLMTAIPRMMQSISARNYEIITALMLCSAHWILNFSLSAVYIFALQLVFIFIFIFILKRFFSAGDFKFFYIFCGEAFLLNLICGIGARLIPAIGRIPAALNPDQAAEKPRYFEFFIYAFFSNSSFLLEFFGYALFAYGMRIVFLIIYAVLEFKILKKPMQPTSIGVGLKFSVLGLILGYALVAFNIGGPLAAMHVVYISGFTLLTLMVASRVAIAHAGRSLNLEINSKPLLVTIGLFMLAAILRYSVLAGSPDLQIAVLISAAVAYLFALWTWKFFILKR